MSSGNEVRIRTIALQAATTVATVAGGLWLLYTLRMVLLLLAFTVIFCYLLLPLVDFVEAPGRRWGLRGRIPRTAAILIVYLLLLALLFIGLERMLPVLADQMSAFVDNVPAYARQFDQTIKWLATLPARYRMPLSWREYFGGAINEVPLRLFEWMQAIFSRTLRLSLFAPWLVLIPVIGFFLLKDVSQLTRKLLEAFPQADSRHRMALFLRDVSSTLASYIRAQVIACLLVGIIEGSGFRLIGLSYPLVLAVAAGILEFIPVIGPFVMMVVAAVIAGFTSLKLAAGVLAFLIGFRIVHDYIIYPRLLSRGMEIHPLLVILAVVGGAEVGGFVGVFLGVPVTALAMVCLRHRQRPAMEQEG